MNSETTSENSEMSPVADVQEMSGLLRELGGNPSGRSNVTREIERVARRLGLGFSRAKSLWYGEARRVDAHEMDRARAEAAALRSAVADAESRLAALEASLTATDEDFHRPVLDRLRERHRARGVG